MEGAIKSIEPCYWDEYRKAAIFEAKDDVRYVMQSLLLNFSDTREFNLIAEQLACDIKITREEAAMILVPVSQGIYRRVAGE